MSRIGPPHENEHSGYGRRVYVKPQPPSRLGLSPTFGHSPRSSRDEVVIVRHSDDRPERSPRHSRQDDELAIVRHGHDDSERPDRSPRRSPRPSTSGALTTVDPREKVRSSGSRPSPFKRLIVCADGRWECSTAVGSMLILTVFDGGRHMVEF
jgi:hypothetical protein